METIAVELRNRRAYLDFPFPEALRDVFSFQAANFWFHPRYKTGHWNGWVMMLRGGAVSSGLFLALQKQAEERGDCRFEIQDTRRFPEQLPFPKDYAVPGFSIRPYQRKCILRMRKASNVGGLILNATGTGKTFIAGLYFRLLKGTGVFVVDELTLLDQAQKEIAKVLGEKVGVIGDQLFAPERITIATVQTLHKHRDRKEFKFWSRGLQVMMIDEVHVALNNRSVETVKSMKPLACFGLTATLELEKEPVWFNSVALCGPEIFRYEYAQGRKEKFLAAGVCVGVNLTRHIPPSEGAEGYIADYSKYIVKSRRRNDLIEGLAREAVKRGFPTAILVERVKHVKMLSARLADIPHRVVWGGVSKEDRILAKSSFEKQKVKLLICNKVFKKGINLKRLSVIIDGAGMAAANDSRQKFGRGVRLCKTKAGLLYFDVGDRKERGRAFKNRFAEPTQKRRRALFLQGVPCLALRGTMNPSAIFGRAERFLQKALFEVSPSV